RLAERASPRGDRARGVAPVEPAPGRAGVLVHVRPGAGRDLRVVDRRPRQDLLAEMRTTPLRSALLALSLCAWGPCDGVRDDTGASGSALDAGQAAPRHAE